MTKIIPAIAGAFLVTAIATPVFAQAAIQEPGAFAFYHPDADVLAGRNAVRQPGSAYAYFGSAVPVRDRLSVAPRHRRTSR